MFVYLLRRAAHHDLKVYARDPDTLKQIYLQYGRKSKKIPNLLGTPPNRVRTKQLQPQPQTQPQQSE